MKKINGWWVTGITDGEGYFTVRVFNTSKCKAKQVKVLFGLSLRADDAEAIRRIVEYFKVGTIYIGKSRLSHSLFLHFVIQRKEDLLRVVNHFNRFPLQSKKKADYDVWEKAAKIFIRRKKGDCLDPSFEKLDIALRNGRKYKGRNWNNFFKLIPKIEGKDIWSFHARTCISPGCRNKVMKGSVCFKCRKKEWYRGWKKENIRKNQDLRWSL